MADRPRKIVHGADDLANDQHFSMRTSIAFRRDLDFLRAREADVPPSSDMLRRLVFRAADAERAKWRK